MPLYITFCLVLITLIPIAVLVLVIWYIKTRNEFQQELLNRLDNLQVLLQQKTYDK